MNPIQSFRPLALLLSLLVTSCPGRAAGVATKETFRGIVGASVAFERGQGATGVQLDANLSAVLYDRVLVEDDGPAIGSDAWWMKTDRAPVIEIAGATRVKKVLFVERPEAAEAHLYVPAGVAVEFNGQPIESGPSNSFPSVPVALLRKGDNEIVLSNRGDTRPHVKVALPEDILRNAPERKGRPRRSFKSVDAGKTWAPIDGEYMVRLHLVQSVPRGELISQCLSLAPATLPGPETPLHFPGTARTLALTADAATPPGTRVELRQRTGDSPVYEAGNWSEWRPAGSAIPSTHGYWQWKAILSTDDARRTPVLRWVVSDLALERPPRPDWAAELKVSSFRNDEIRSTSIPFEYENPLHPRLVELRKNYQLDRVVAGAKTELEQFVLLRDWVAHQWKYAPPEENYPAWDADEILRRKAGFCVQYAVVLLQAALSMGHQARFVFGYNPDAFDGGGHEVCEIWSNQYRKWVFMDVNQNWHLIDPKSRRPMSLLDVHDLILSTYYGDAVADLAHPPLARKPSDELAICYGQSLEPGAPPAEFARHFVDGHYTAPTRWLYIHYLPRNDFFARTYPLPKTQGTHWDWSDYWCWEDRQTPKRWQYRNFTARRSDLDWSLNQICFDAVPAAEPETLLLTMGTFTPFLDTLEVRADEQAWQPSSRSFAWKLHAGGNRLEMRTRNRAGVHGPVSFLAVDYQPRAGASAQPSAPAR